MIEAHQRHPIRILSYCVLSNHWHFVVWPEADGQVTAFFRWLAHTHAMRWRVAHRTVGYGPLYQGRFKSFPVQSDEHLLTVLRYVERNALGAGLVARAEQWRWGSLWARRRGDKAHQGRSWRPGRWSARGLDPRVNAPLSAKELGRLRVSLERGRPYGEDGGSSGRRPSWGWSTPFDPQGRPPKPKQSESPFRN